MIVAKVKLWGTTIGAVSIDEDSPYCLFKYDKGFLKSGINLSPIAMPLSDEIYQFKALSLNSFKGLPGLLCDSLPDKYGNEVINAWIVAEGRTIESFNIIERLCYIGTRGMGALEFYPDLNNGMCVSENIEVEKLITLSNIILNKKENIKVKDKDKLEDIIKVGTSAGGARAKAIIAYNEETGVIKSGQIDAGKGFTYWILKLDGVDQKDDPAFTRIEYAYYLMALDARINMSESRLLHIGNYYHFMTKRFDRILLDNGSYGKLHMQTLGALAHIDYNEPAVMSYEQATHIMSKLKISLIVNEQFFRRMVFNVMARNQDDHVKNISFLMDRSGKWSLSPAYDITYSYNPNGKWTNNHQMLINGKRNSITREDLLKSANAMKIKENKALEIIDEITNALLNWKEFAKKAHLNKEVTKTIENEFILL